MFTKRGLIVPMMTTFDMCDTTLPTGRRGVSIVPTQALTLLNNEWVGDRAAAFAASVVGSGEEQSVRVSLAWRRAFGRPPTAAERATAEAYLAVAREDTSVASLSEAWRSLCLVLFNTNEFLFVD